MHCVGRGTNTEVCITIAKMFVGIYDEYDGRKVGVWSYASEQV